MTELLGCMADAWLAPASDPDHDWLHRARHLMRRITRPSPRALADVASAMGVTERTFRRRYKALGGIPPSRFLARCRIDAACRRLLETEEKIAAIAAATGFANAFHFSRRFKQLTGMTPGEYRQSHRNR